MNQRIPPEIRQRILATEHAEQPTMTYRELKLTRRRIDWLFRHYDAEEIVDKAFDDIEDLPEITDSEDCLRALSRCTWNDLYAEGQWYLRARDVNYIARQRLSAIRSAPVPKKGRLFWAKQGDRITIHWFGRDLHPEMEDWWLCFYEKKAYASKMAEKRRYFAAERRLRAAARKEDEALAKAYKDWKPEDAIRPEDYRKLESRAALQVFLRSFDWRSRQETRLSDVCCLMRFEGKILPIVFNADYSMEAICELQRYERAPEEIPAYVRDLYIEEDFEDALQYETLMQKGHWQLELRYWYGPEPVLPETCELLAVLTESECADFLLRLYFYDRAHPAEEEGNDAV